MILIRYIKVKDFLIGGFVMRLGLKNLVKRYRDQIAVDDVDLILTPGVWGLLGANGAGKTTLMNMISNILSPTSGQIYYNGHDISSLGSAYRNIYGYLPQKFGFYPEFTVIGYLNYIAALKGLSAKDSKRRISYLLELMGLEQLRRKKIRKLSGGMQRRVGIAQALVNDPELLILDEPTSGLDPGERVYFRNILSEFAQKRIVLISTHIVSDIENIAVCNAVMKDGKIIAVKKTEQLLEMVEGMVWKVNLHPSQIEDFASKVCIVNMRNLTNDLIEIRYVSEKNQLNHAELMQPNLEDYYLWTFQAETKGRRYHV